MDAQATGVWPELESLAQPARERRRLEPETRSRIILQLCARVPLSVKELSELLNRSEAYVGDAIRPLVTQGALTFLYPDQPRHPKQKYLTPAPAQPTPVSVPAPAPVPTQAAPVSIPAPAPKPAPGFVQAPARKVAPAAAPAPEEAREAAKQSRRGFRPNQWTNGLVVLIVGILLSYWHVFMWPMFAAVVGVLLAVLHIYTNSTQYQRYRELHSANRTRRRTLFVLLKTLVAIAEISIVYFATAVLQSAQ